MGRPSDRIEGSHQEAVAERVSVPVSLLDKILEASRAIEAFQDELEEYLLSQDDAFVVQMRQARAHHLEGEVRPLDALKRELCIE